MSSAAVKNGWRLPFYRREVSVSITHHAPVERWRISRRRVGPEALAPYVRVGTAHVKLWPPKVEAEVSQGERSTRGEETEKGKRKK